MPRILAVNPGATSTRIAIFDDDALVEQFTLRHGDDELDAFGAQPVLAQLELRLGAIRRALGDPTFAAVAGRGGLLAPLPGGTYLVDAAMLADLTAARRGEHASNLGPFLAQRLAQRSGCPAFIVDPVSVDEWDDVARYSGMAGIERASLSHALNSKAVARRHARAHDTSYQQLRLVIVHLGSGITVSAHRHGRMIDACNSMEEGPFAMDRAGGVPVMQLLELACSGTIGKAELQRRLFGAGGVYSYLGTRDLPQVLERSAHGDSRARDVVAAMLYQVAKEAGAMAAVLHGRVDAVLITGGMAHAAAITDVLSARLNWIAPVFIYPGEDELRALAEGALRVLRGEETARNYTESRLDH